MDVQGVIAAADNLETLVSHLRLAAEAQASVDKLTQRRDELQTENSQLEKENARLKQANVAEARAKKDAEARTAEAKKQEAAVQSRLKTLREQFANVA
jgi:DNA repair exonuclease SbcCD ATPase subunit